MDSLEQKLKLNTVESRSEDRTRSEYGTGSIESDSVEPVQLAG